MGNLTPKQEKMIGLLLTERTTDGACQKAGVSPTTLWRWMQDQHFLAEYRRMRRGILENTVARLQAATYQAIETLERNLNCENPASEIRAAQVILEQAIKGLDALDIENRVEMLEAMLKDWESKK